MHGGTQYNPIKNHGQGQGHEPLKVGNSTISKRYLIPHLQWGQANYHGFLNSGTILKAYRGRFLNFCPSFCVIQHSKSRDSRDFEC